MVLPYQQLADLVLVLHAAVVAFVVACPPLVIVGNRRRWAWVNRRGLRVAHLAAIGLVVAQAWLGLACPLTRLEVWLRTQARQPGYDGSFVEHWLRMLLFWEAPAWVFVAVYTAFGLMVAALWWRLPPTPRVRRRPTP